MKFLLKKIIRKLYHLISFLCLFLLFANNVNASSTNTLTVNLVRYYDISGNTYDKGNYSGLQSNKLLNNMYIFFKANSGTGITGKYAIFSGFTNVSQMVSNQSYTFNLTPVALTNGSIQNPNSCFFNDIQTTKTPDEFNSSSDGYYYVSWVVSCKLDNALGSANNSNVLHFNLDTSSGTKVITTWLSDRFYIVDDPWNNKGQEIVNELQESNQKLNDIDSTLNDSSTDSSDSTISNLQSDLPTNSVISDILLLPVRLLQAIINSLGSTCSNFNLGSLYGTNLVMPCIDIQNYVGSAIWTFIDLVFSGMFVLVIRKKFIQIWENITNLKGGGNEVD